MRRFLVSFSILSISLGLLRISGFGFRISGSAGLRSAATNQLPPILSRRIRLPWSRSSVSLGLGKNGLSDGLNANARSLG
jgi:hypothetical protein